METFDVNINLNLGDNKSSSGDKGSSGGFVNSVKGAINTVKGATAGGGKGFLGSIMKNVGSMISTGLKATGVIGLLIAIASASKMLMRSVGMLLKIVSSMVNVFMQIFSMALMPLIMVLKPLALFLKMMMAPYKQKMGEAMRTGNEFYKQYLESGKQVPVLLTQAMKSWGMAILYAFKPIFDLITYLVEGLINGLIIVIFGMLDALIGLIPGVGERLEKIKEALTTGVSTAFEGMRNKSTEILDDVLYNNLMPTLEAAKTVLYNETGALKVDLSDTEYYAKVNTALSTFASGTDKSASAILLAAKKLDDWRAGSGTISSRDSITMDDFFQPYLEAYDTNWLVNKLPGMDTQENNDLQCSRKYTSGGN